MRKTVTTKMNVTFLSVANYFHYNTLLFLAGDVIFLEIMKPIIPVLAPHFTLTGIDIICPLGFPIFSSICNSFMNCKRKTYIINV